MDKKRVFLQKKGAVNDMSDVLSQGRITAIIRSKVLSGIS